MKKATSLTLNVIDEKRDMSISLVRVLSMCAIIFCHYGSYCGSHIVAPFFNIGVQIFFIISGFLYGQKEIQSWGKWYERRWAQLMIPCYIAMGILTLIFSLYFHWPINTKSILCQLFNLQGGRAIVASLTCLSTYPGLGALWFMTPLMMCYFCIPFFQWLKPGIGKLSSRQKQCFLLAGTIIVSLLIFCFGLNFSALIIFAFGYYWGGNFSNFTRKEFLYWSLMALPALATRWIGRMYWDDSPLNVAFFHFFSVFYLAAYLFRCVVSGWRILQYKYPDLSTVKFVNKHLPFWDKISYYLFITHCIFLTTPISMANCFGGCKWLEALLMLVLSFLSAIILMMLSNPLIRSAIKLFK